MARNNVLGAVVQNADACQQWAYDKGVDAIMEQLPAKLTLDVLANFFSPSQVWYEVSRWEWKNLLTHMGISALKKF